MTTKLNVMQLLSLKKAKFFFHVSKSIFKHIAFLNFCFLKGLYETFLIIEQIEKSSIKYCM